MEVKYFADTDTMHLGLSESAPTESQEISENLIVDYDDSRRFVGLTIEHARNEALAPDFFVSDDQRRRAGRKKLDLTLAPACVNQLNVMSDEGVKA